MAGEKAIREFDQVPLEKFYRKARLFDFRSKPRDQPLLASDFENQTIEPDDIVIVYVGYTPPADPEELPSYPYMSAEAAEYLLGKSIKAVATDMPRLGSVRRYLKLIKEGQKGAENIFPEHYALLSKDIPVIEVLTNLERLVGETDIVVTGKRKFLIYDNRKLHTLQFGGQCSPVHSVGDANRNGAAYRCMDGRPGCC